MNFYFGSIVIQNSIAGMAVDPLALVFDGSAGGLEFSLSGGFALADIAVIAVFIGPGDSAVAMWFSFSDSAVVVELLREVDDTQAGHAVCWIPIAEFVHF